MLQLPPSLQSEYGLVYSGDPALDLPADEAERENALRVARETGDWSKLVKPGEQPTVFNVQLSGRAFTRVQDCKGNLQICEAAFRYGVRGVRNAGELKVKQVRIDGLTALSDETLDQIYEMGGAACIYEIGTLIYQRTAELLSPRS